MSRPSNQASGKLIVWRNWLISIVNFSLIKKQLQLLEGSQQKMNWRSLTTCQRLLIKHLSNLYCEFIFPLLSSKAVIALISRDNFCLIKQQLQPLKQN